MTSPISYIPPELLSKIFLFTVTDSPVDFNPRNERFTLTQVSSRWRTVALQTSEVWSDICICADENKSESEIFRKTFPANEWLERPGPPVPIPPKPNDHGKLCSALTDLIRPYTERLWKLNIVGYSTSTYLCKIVRKATTPGQLPILEDLILIVTASYRLA
ncbi:hypothetical protein BDQ17DRAFT_540672 [Cyathus striatus]|nr:hypothetical protein BDQ17DRAFT_540672 [Cyathus striatus]